jgi:hypothetical protein
VSASAFKAIPQKDSVIKRISFVIFKKDDLSIIVPTQSR